MILARGFADSVGNRSGGFAPRTPQSISTKMKEWVYST